MPITSPLLMLPLPTVQLYIDVVNSSAEIYFVIMFIAYIGLLVSEAISTLHDSDTLVPVPALFRQIES